MRADSVAAGEPVAGVDFPFFGGGCPFGVYGDAEVFDAFFSGVCEAVVYAPEGGADVFYV